MIYGMMLPKEFEHCSLPFEKKLEIACEHVIRSGRENNFEIKHLIFFKNMDGHIGWVCGNSEQEVNERIAMEKTLWSRV